MTVLHEDAGYECTTHRMCAFFFWLHVEGAFQV